MMYRCVLVVMINFEDEKRRRRRRSRKREEKRRANPRQRVSFLYLRLKVRDPSGDFTFSCRMAAGATRYWSGVLNFDHFP